MEKLVYIIIFLTVLYSCESRYDWSPSECAPQHYPAEILYNNYQYKNGGGVGTLQRTAGGSGWGNAGGGYAVGERLKPVPDSLFVNWFSITEGKFYKGSFKLNSAAIEKELKAGDVCIYTCFAPYGRVVVYTTGIDGSNAIQRLRAVEDTTMTVLKYRFKNTQVSSVEEYEVKFAKKMMPDSLYLKTFLSDEDKAYIAKHGIPDKW